MLPRNERYQNCLVFLTVWYEDALFWNQILRFGYKKMIISIYLFLFIPEIDNSNNPKYSLIRMEIWEFHISFNKNFESKTKNHVLHIYEEKWRKICIFGFISKKIVEGFQAELRILPHLWSSIFVRVHCNKLHR